MTDPAALAVARIVFGGGFTVAVAWALGRWFLRWTGADERLARGERLIFAFGLGAAWLSQLVFLLSAAQLAYAPVFLVAGTALLIAGARGRASPPAPLPDGSGLPRPLALLLLLVTAAYGYLYLAHTLAPEIGPDAASYHLGLVSRYLREHGFSRLTTNLYAALSQGVEMLFLFAFAFGRHSAAKVIHFAFLAATAGAMVCFGRRFGLGAAAPLAAVLFAVSPVVGADAASAYNDVALAFYAFLTFYLLLMWEQTRARALRPAIGVAAGFCYAIKYTGFLAVPFALGFLIWKSRPSPIRDWLPTAARVTLVAALFVLPWMAKSTIIFGNPVAPFFNRLFPNPHVHVSWESFYGWRMRHYAGMGERSWTEYLEVPLQLTARGDKLAGFLGPVFLLAPLGLAALRQPVGRRLWAAALIFALPWLANHGTRFLIPSLAFVSLAMAMALWRAPRRIALALSLAVVVGHAASSWPSVVDRWNRRPYLWRLAAAPWKAALRLEPEAAYLRPRLPESYVAQMIEAIVPPGAKVFAPSGNVAEAYTSRDVLVSFQSATGEVLMDHLLVPVEYGADPVWNIRYEWSPRELTGVRLVQMGSDSFQRWSIHELVLFSGTERLEPQPDWLLRARPNPWGAGLAVDGNLATRWRSWQPLYPGMRYQVDLPRPVRLTALELHTSADHPQARLELEGRDPSGRWLGLDSRERRSPLYPSRQEMKRLATRALKWQGIDYLVTDIRPRGGPNLIAPDIDKDPLAWGLRELWFEGPIRLYYIE